MGHRSNINRDNYENDSKFIGQVNIDRVMQKN